jgi:hypothetical protein
MNEKITLLKHELKNLINGGIKDISKFDNILLEIERICNDEQRKKDKEFIEDLISQL